MVEQVQSTMYSIVSMDSSPENWTQKCEPQTSDPINNISDTKLMEQLGLPPFPQLISQLNIAIKRFSPEELYPKNDSKTEDPATVEKMVKSHSSSCILEISSTKSVSNLNSPEMGEKLFPPLRRASNQELIIGSEKNGRENDPSVSSQLMVNRFCSQGIFGYLYSMWAHVYTGANAP